MSRVIGIDLGTTHSVAATIANGRPLLIPNAEGSYLTPSVVAFLRDGSRLVGQLAERQAATNSDHTIFSIKRRMGSDYKVNVNARLYTPEEISAFILQKIKRDAERFLGENVEQAVITVPAYFNDNQRRATRDAGVIAGLQVIRIINEPTAASLAYGLHREEIHRILVWDLGGGTFDVSILELGERFFEVKAVNGDTWLGGDDWDQRIVDYLADEFQSQYGIALRHDKVALQRLKEAAENAKIKLSQTLATTIRIPCLCSNRQLQLVLTREKLEAMTADLLERMVAPTRQALADANLRPEQIDRVVLVGGASRTPAVQRLVQQLLGVEPYKEIDPDLVVAIGAAIQAGILTGEVNDVVLLDVTPLSLGIETRGGIFAKIINRNTTIPVSANQIFTNAYEGQAEIDVHVLQGERAMASDNISLGRFQLAIPPTKRQQARIEVTFKIDVDGITHVRAQDLHSGIEGSLSISSSSRLSANEVTRLVAEAQRYAAEDESRRQAVQTALRAENAICLAEQQLEEATDEAATLELEEAILILKAAISTGESKKIEGGTDALQKVTTKWERLKQCVAKQKAHTRNALIPVE